jgi:hypothetical protein
MFYRPGLENATPNMALQRTRALAVARVRSLPSVARHSPLNARPLGGTN